MFLKQVIRKNVNALRSADLSQLRALLDQYINKRTDNPVKEDRDASSDARRWVLSLAPVLCS
jgi:hypothetical protein